MDGTTVEAPPAEHLIRHGAEEVFPRPGFRLARPNPYHIFCSSSGQVSVPCLTGEFSQEHRRVTGVTLRSRFIYACARGQGYERS